MTDDLLVEDHPPIPEGYRQMDWRRGFGTQVGPLYQREDGADYARAFFVQEHHVNGMNNCHGGMLMTFADMAWGHAISVIYKRYWVTVRLVTDFVSAAHLGEWVEGNAQIVSNEADFITVKGRIWVGDRTVMTGTGVFKVLGERPRA